LSNGPLAAWLEAGNYSFSSLTLLLTGRQPPLSKVRMRSTPRAWAMRWRVSSVILWRPLSIREIAEWLVPARSASSPWESFRATRWILMRRASPST